MLLFITVLHVILCLILVVVILLQPGKGGDVSSAFGGGASSSMFGPRGAAAPLSRITSVVAVLFMFTSITLAVSTNRMNRGTGGEIEETPELDLDAEGEGFGVGPTAPAADPAAEAPAAPPADAAAAPVEIGRAHV